VVETVGLELRTHHPVIEPVSGSAGNGNFRRGDGGPKSGSPVGRDRHGDYEKRAKARVSQEECEGTQPGSSPGDWVVGAPGLEPGTR
jgi:hypothetical protein